MLKEVINGGFYFDILKLLCVGLYYLFWMAKEDLHTDLSSPLTSAIQPSQDISKLTNQFVISNTGGGGGLMYANSAACRDALMLQTGRHPVSHMVRTLMAWQTESQIASISVWTQDAPLKTICLFPNNNLCVTQDIKTTLKDEKLEVVESVVASVTFCGETNQEGWFWFQHDAQPVCMS